jgi:aldose 1-epimerase
MTDALTLDATDAEVILAPDAGGAIAAFTFRGMDVLRPTTVEDRDRRNVHGHACFPLIPYSNRIADGSLVFEGTTHTLARNSGDNKHSIHGVGWERPWKVEARDRTSALLAFAHEPTGDDAKIWPWPFAATLVFALASDGHGASLAVKLGIVNTGTAPFPFGLGFHPYFPKPPSTTLRFSAEGMWETDSTMLPLKCVPLGSAERFDPARTLEDTTLDNVFVGWDGVATLTHPREGLVVTIGADRTARFLVVYTPRARNYLAVEPVTHMTDAFNRMARGESDTGARVLDAGATFSYTMRIDARKLT